MLGADIFENDRSHPIDPEVSQEQINRSKSREVDYRDQRKKIQNRARQAGEKNRDDNPLGLDYGGDADVTVRPESQTSEQKNNGFFDKVVDVLGLSRGKND